MSGSDFSVDIVATAADCPLDLWEACFPKPLEGMWWYDALDRCGIEDQFTFSYAVIEQGGQAVGIAPLFAMDVPIDLVMPPALLPLFRLAARLRPSVMFQRTLFVGSLAGDEGTVGLLPDVDRPAALSALHQAVDRLARQLRAPMLVWKDFPAETDDEMQALAARHGLFRLVSYPGTLAELPGSGKKADYFAAMKGSRRHILKKKLKRSAEQVAVETAVIQRPTATVIGEIFALFWQTYERSEVKFEQLNRRFFELLAEHPGSHFITLREQASGQMIAFMLCFDMGDRVINKFIGIDYARPKEWLLYFRLWEAVLDWGLARGTQSIQSGQTGYAPKIEMGHALTPLTNYCRHQNPLVHWVYGLVARMVGWRSLEPDLERFLTAHPEAEIPAAKGRP